MVQIPKAHIEIIVGLLLSDAWLILPCSHSKNARLGLKQSLGHFQYFWHVFLLLSHYCSSFPLYTTGIRAGVRFHGIQFHTRALPCFTELHSLFYVLGTKGLPPVEFLYEILTPVALAHWIMGDGCARTHGLILCTESFSLPEVVLLINILKVRYDLDCTIQYHRKAP